ncbi:MAG: hypothetical protein ACE5IQ_04305 [Candidatus Methylomirabilales bacterium]
MSWLLPILSGVLLSGCALFASAPPEHVSLRPAPSRLPTYTVSGHTIIATPGPISVAVRPVGPEDVHRYFRRRPTRVNPLRELGESVTPFFVRIENRSKDHVTFDPALTVLKDQENRSTAAWDAADLYQMFADTPALLRAAQGAVFARYLVIRAEQSREGLVVFPAFRKDAKAVFLQFTSLYAGSMPFPLIFEFIVVPQVPKN